MMIEKHYSDEVLISFLEAGDASAIAHDVHLASCQPCSETLGLLRSMTQELKQEAVWDRQELSDTPNLSTLHFLRDVAAEMAAEDAAAAANLPLLLAGPRETWASRLAQHPEWRTAGMVRKLVEEVERATSSMPPDAVEITAIAVDIAASLRTQVYSQATVASLYVSAWRERAYALMFVGQYAGALEAVDTADAALSALSVSDYDRARVTLVRALILRELEQFESALLCAMESASAFGAFGDTKREIYATWTEGAIAYRKRDFPTALTLFKMAERGLRGPDELSSHAILLQNIASCHREMGEHKNAMAYFEQAMAAYDQIGSVAARVRMRWHIGKTLLLQGYHNSALQQLEAVRNEFEGLQMETESRLAALDVAECLVALQRDRQVVELCSALIVRFEKSGLTNTAGAMTALAFLREAAAKKQEPIAAVKHVRRYFEALQKQPALLFAPPPA